MRKTDTTRGRKLVCSFCKKNPRRPNQWTCKDCHAAYMRADRAAKREATR